ncbi:HD domain-containing protein [Desulforamulus ruminis]|uniref:HD domain-containing protein n=1 Tax=Desulforamulus ruminis TaxID=1564 RepID=UPI00235495DB|nr:HD domain-containing protein [Desulforamulus ruminis]
MLNRIGQFAHALFSKIGPSEKKYIQTHLNDQEQRLFFSLDRPTQTHCVRVARTCQVMMAKEMSVRQHELIRAALLHDIGKPANIIRTRHRVFIVLLTLLAPGLLKRILRQPQGWGKLGQAVLAHVQHPDRGAEMAAKIKLPPDIIDLIRHHHQPYRPGEPMELTILRRADELN